MLKLYQNIKARRKELRLSQEELAAKIGYSSRSMVAKIEAGKIDLYQSKIAEIAKALETTPEYLMGWEPTSTSYGVVNKDTGVLIPVLGKVAAGIPIEAITDVIDTEEITQETAEKGDHFGLKIKGDSMYPRILDGDVVIVRRQPDVESGDIAVVMVNGSDATCKKIIKHGSGITLQPLNNAFEPVFYSNSEIEQLPVSILGKVVELRGKF